MSLIVLPSVAVGSLVRTDVDAHLVATNVATEKVHTQWMLMVCLQLSEAEHAAFVTPAAGA